MKFIFAAILFAACGKICAMEQNNSNKEIIRVPCEMASNVCYNFKMKLLLSALENMALMGESLEKITYFYTYNVDECKIPLIYKILRYPEYINLLKYILKQGADINKASIPVEPLKHLPLRRLLEVVIEMGNLEFVELMLDHGADVIESDVIKMRSIPEVYKLFKKRCVAHLADFLSRGKKLDQFQGFGPFPADIAYLIAQFRYRLN